MSGKRYRLYGGAAGFAGGGYRDFLSAHRSFADARVAADGFAGRPIYRHGANWWHIVDTRTDEIVAESDCRPYGAPEKRAKQ